MNIRTSLVPCMSLASVALFVTGLAHATSGIWTLSDNVTLTEDHGGTIVTNGFRVDCAGHYIYNLNGEKSCHAGTESCGINADYSSHSKVDNCHIEGFDVAVHGMDGEALDLRNSYLQYNSNGLSLTSWNSSPHTAIEDNYITDNGNYGVYLLATDSLQVNRNKVWLNGAHGAVVLYGSGSNHFEGNDFWSNGSLGFYCIQTTGIDLWQGIVEANGGGTTGGIVLSTCNGFDVWANSIINNNRYGLYVADSDNGIVEANYGVGNVTTDAIQTSSSTGNTWLNNTWGVTSPAGLP